MFLRCCSVKLIGAAFVIAVFSQTLNAAVYVYKDKNGVPVFTDQPHPNAKVISAKSKIENIPSVDLNDRLDPQNGSESVTYDVRLMRPADKETFRNNAGNLQVTIQVLPIYASGLKAQILLDGTPVTDPQAMSTFQLHNVFRGEHSLSVNLLDANGKVIASSDARTFYMHRATINHTN